MEFRKMITMTLYMRQQKRHKYKEQIFGLCGRGWGWDDLGEWHWNMYIIICETNRQSRFDAWDRVLRAGVLGWPWRMRWGGRWERGSGWEHMYTHGWFMSTYGETSNVINLQLKWTSFFFFKKQCKKKINKTEQRCLTDLCSTSS